MTKHPVRLETVAVSVTEDMLEAFEAALANACPTVGFFRDQDTGIWRVEGVKQVGVNDAELASSPSGGGDDDGRVAGPVQIRHRGRWLAGADTRVVP